jgi:hypothetical protein
MRRLLVRAIVVPSSPILVTLIKEALNYPEPSALTRATRRNVPEDTILHSDRREELISYKRVYAYSHTYRLRVGNCKWLQKETKWLLWVKGSVWYLGNRRELFMLQEELQRICYCSAATDIDDTEPCFPSSLS